MIHNILLDFSNIYPEDMDFRKTGLTRIRLNDISGTNMYCTEEAACEIRKRLEPYGPEGIHFLDNGNYHYATLFFTEKIREPFSLVLIDHHTDMQKPMIPRLTSCGSWAGELIGRNSNLRQLILIGQEQRSMDAIGEDLREKLVCISMEELEQHGTGKETGRIDMTVPIYISVDKDVLSPYYARTNWNQGNMSADILKKLLKEVFIHQKVIGVDICGECSLQEPVPQLMEDREINAKLNANLYQYLRKLFRHQREEEI